MIERYFFFGLLLATLIFTLLIFSSFWVVLILGLCFSIVLYPVYEWLKKNKLPDWLSALVTVLLFAIVLCGPILGIGALVFNQSQDMYQQVAIAEKTQPFLNSINNSVNRILPEGIVFDVEEKVKDFISYVSGNIANVFSSAISAFFSFLLTLLIIFYFLKDGTRWKKTLVVFSPLPDTDDEKIISRLTLVVNAVIKGYLFIAIIQGILLGFGFWMFNVPNGALWGVVAAVTSLIPTFGTALVSVPAILFLFFTGNTASAAGLSIWAVIIVGTIDNFLSPLLVGNRINISPFLILFSVLGGISLLGPVGILVGPLTISLLYALISIYRNELKQNTGAQ